MKSMKERRDSVKLRIADIVQALKCAFDAQERLETEASEQERDTLRCPPPAGAFDV